MSFKLKRASSVVYWKPFSSIFVIGYGSTRRNQMVGLSGVFGFARRSCCG